MLSIFLKKPLIVFHSSFQFYTPAVVNAHSSCSTSLPILGITSLFYFNKFNGYILLSDHLIISSLINDIGHLFMFVGHLYISFLKASAQFYY